MPFTTITPPVVGDPTILEKFTALIDNATFLYTQLLSAIGAREIVVNGSFEADNDSDGIPDAWTRTLYTGGTFLLDQSTVAADDKSIHGKRAAKFTSPGGGGNGGGYIELTDPFECTTGRPLLFSWQMKSSAAGVHTKAEVVFYDCTKTLLSTTTLFDSTTNPTVWSLIYGIQTMPPANARYCKIRLYGAMDDNTTAGSVWFDDVKVASIPLDNRVEFHRSGEFKWVCPSGVRFVSVEIWGAGGGGEGADTSPVNAGAGGGAGGYCRSFLAVTPGSTYNFELGAGGAGSVSSGTPLAGGDGGDSTITIGAAVLLAEGGVGGSGGSGGAGGAASGGQENVAGIAGNARASSSVGGDGGYNARFGIAANTNGSAPGTAGPGYGSGGSGGGGGTNDGADGSDGGVILRW